MVDEQDAINRAEWENPANWGGPDWMAVYFSKRDARTWVPKRAAWMGWTVNLGTRGGVRWLFGLVIGLPTVAIVFVTGLVLTAGIARGDEVAAENFPPVVVRTVPTAGDTAVDPGLDEIRVTFSRDMMTEEMWSFVYANPAPFPKITGEIRYVDARTCVLPVSLDAGRTYGLWINSKEHDSFRDKRQQPAVPYLLVFSTRR